MYRIRFFVNLESAVMRDTLMDAASCTSSRVPYQREEIEKFG